MQRAEGKMHNYPVRQEAERLVREAEACNPGPWGDHSRVAAACAEKIAAAAGMDRERAYILGLLHDIGRKFGVKHLGHVYDGYRYMMESHYPAAARICLTHSFSRPTLEVYIGKRDIYEVVGLFRDVKTERCPAFVTAMPCHLPPRGKVKKDEAVG